MDHLACFLPGALALDVFHHGGLSKAEKEFGCADCLGGLRHAGNVSTLPERRIYELLIAHKLAQTCAHMYFRTGSDLAPEITRFDAFGLVDDEGSMHNILRPETV